jgi:cytochrome c oxidase subunit 2
MIHIDIYEKWWIAASLVVLVIFAMALGVAGFALGIQVPVPEARVDPNTVGETGPFADPGLRELAPGKYEAYVLAQASPWRFYPEEMHLPAGSRVTFYLTSADVQHGFLIPGTNVNVMVLPGQVSKLTATFDEPGTYPYICSEYCGVGHQNMFGTIIVE